MEDGFDGPLSNLQVSDHMKNGVVSPIMANFPEGTVTEAKDNKNSIEPPKVNGESNQDSQDIQNNPFQDSYSSESDALVIDESVPKKKRVRSKYNKKPKDNIRRTSEKENDSDFSNPSDTKEKVNSDKNLQVGLVKDSFNDSMPSSALNKTVRSNEIHTFIPNISNENTQTSDNFSANNDILESRISETHTHCDVPRLTSDVSSTQELLSHSNPFFHESLFELSQLHHNHYETSCANVSEPQNSKDISSNCNRTLKRVKPKPKLQEYAQYLGLQPAVQFKCPKCGKSGFESLVTLQDHFLQCNSVQILEKTTENENVSGFKLTRKVFLCSTCGTYYENWNLYMHMLEYHRRYICLYCLGMFSILEDLCQHIQSRHNLEPGIKNTLEDFYNTYNEPCYVVCCECNRQFNEGDNFFYHNCVPTKSSAKSKPKHVKQVIAPENHVTGDFVGPPSEIPNRTEPMLQPQRTDTVKTHSKEKSEENSEKLPLETESLPVKSLEGESNQVDSDKQNFIETQKSKASFSESSENDDDIVIKEKPLSTEDNSSIGNTTETKPSDSLDKDNIEENCEQDSLDSTKISEGNLENLASAENTMDGIEENLSDSREMDEHHEEPVETRRVPKLSLKLPKPGSYPEPDPDDSDDSEKHDMEVDNIESENDHNLSDTEQTEEQHEDQQEESFSEEKEDTPPGPHYPAAGVDIPIIEIELDHPLDKMDIRVLLQKCLQATVPSCIYCNHSRRISVNGKQLGLHAMSEHRYSAINKSITEEELSPDSFNSRIAECLGQLETVFFNLESGDSEEAVTFSHVFECFQCHYSTTVHKELYLHNRKFHSKSLLLCIMCKSNFYSYSELICHLCPGVYVLDYDLQFRCCMCVSDVLPSSFRLMVHLRKRHNVCDVCLEMCHSQYKLSSHVWKHKLHHFCYRCGIAYRNKPDITRHLFWKHGTESVMCKKCLQKKWPHVYHFCVPPPSFTCEECNLVFTKAVSLKVHKRLHTDEKKHPCTWEECTESFVSKKLMLKHLKRHTDPPEEEKVEEVKENVESKENESVEEEKGKDEIKEPEEPPKLVKPKVDVYDLPELNLSESDTSDSETEPEKPRTEESSASQQSEDTQEEKPEGDSVLNESQENMPADQVASIPQEQQACDLPQQPIVDEASSTAMQNIWDNFKNYQANKEKLDHMLIGEVESKIDQPYVPDIPIPVVEEGINWQLALRDHDYCIDPEETQAPDTIIEVKPSLESTESIDHDYCFQSEKQKVEPVVAVPPPQESPAQEDIKKSPARKRSNSSSSSSSGSDSSCACGSDCSCSDSSSGSSSSSSDSSNSDSSTEEGRKRQQQRRLKRKERTKVLKKQRTKTESDAKVDVVTSDQPPVVVETPIRESDLETTESETDEEFYDREPQKFAKKILEEKRAQLLAEMGPHMVPNGSFIESTSRPPTPPAGTVEEEEQPKKKKKTKKRKKRKSDKKDPIENRTYSATLIMDSEPIVPPPAIPYYQQFHQTLDRQSPTVAPITLSLARNSPVQAPQTPPSFSPTESHSLSRQDSTASDSSVRASKRRRVPNKFYGYSSDEEAEKPQSLKRSKVENNRTIPAPASPMLVPPITIKTIPSPAALPPRPPMVEPITLRLPRPLHPSNDFKSHRKPMVPPIRLVHPRPPLLTSRDDSATESNDSDNDDPVPPAPILEPPKPPQPQLYCYCRCPYDEVSEMIGCDSSECQIEWFHFECVGIMVPPKGQWFCPDCRKRKQQQRRDMLA